MPTVRQFAPCLCAVVLAVGCTTSGDADGAPTAAVLTSVCDAAAAADRTTAEEAFGDAHTALHDLARELQTAGRRDVAGDLLVAKQQVEAAFATTRIPDDLHDRLERLATATGAAVAVDSSDPGTCAARR